MSDRPAVTFTRETGNPNPPRPRRSTPLSLRMFMGILVLIGLGSSVWVGVPLYRQQIAIQTVNDLGGTVEMARGGPNWLRQLIGDEPMRWFDSVRYVDFRSGDITDADLEHLAPLKDIEFLDLSGTQISDRGIGRLKDFKKLGGLCLWHTAVTRAGIDDLWLALPDVQIGIRFDEGSP